MLLTRGLGGALGCESIYQARQRTMVPKSVAIRPIGGGIRSWVLAITLGALVLPAGAAAQPAITWTAPSDCPDQPAVIARVRRLMRHNTNTTATAQVHVDRVDDSYRAELQLTSTLGEGRRNIENDDCEVLADSVALIYALASSRSSEEARSGWRWTIAISGAGVLGTLPALAGGGRVTLGIEWSRLRIDLNAASMWPQTAALGDGLLSGRFQLATASIGARVLFGVGALEVAPGLGVEGYYIAATGLGGMSSRTGRALGVGPLVSLLLRLRLSDHWALCASVFGAAPIVRARFVFTDAGSLHEVPTVTGGFGLGMELRP